MGKGGSKVANKLLIFIIAVGLLVPLQHSWGEDYDFRLTKWGMTQNDVIAVEEKMDPVERNETLLVYKTKISNKNVLLQYLFIQDKLVGAIYRLDENYLNSDHFIQTYQHFKQKLANKYGSPSRDSTKWFNDTFKNNRKKWGLALSLGHTEYMALWQTPKTTIECSLKEKNLNILCLLEYWSTEHSQLMDQVKKEEKIEVF